MIAALGVAYLVSDLVYGVTLSMEVVFGIILGMLMLNVLTWIRLKFTLPVRDRELLLQLLVDVSLLTTLFYFTGGYTNPFVWMYLLPLSIAAVALSWQATWMIALLSIVCYSGLMLWYQPLSDMVMSEHAMPGMTHPDAGFNLHLLGMWVGFVISACVISFFVHRIGRHLRRYDQLLAESREKILQSERMLALGALATGAAHELGTPLSTMAVLTKELSHDYAEDAALAESLRLLRTQVDRCKTILSSMTASAGAARSDGAMKQSLDAWMQGLVSRWSDTRPGVPVAMVNAARNADCMVVADLALGQAITNLINNAADASPAGISLRYGCEGDMFSLDIMDQGQFVAAYALDQIGSPFFTTKKEQGGMGLGLFLAKSIIEQLGGTLTFEHTPGRGTKTRLQIPIFSIAAA